ncbi:acyltransferase [Elizabethkingia anophelis]|uniref:acyltransferase n=1 Tax=Elizabethkingia anophelis TaxID=1117645 RepID=UPI000B35991F|nr:DapH/DapD/GlmU-related protein [Elizabethkingia anophelis]MCT4326768.1 acyltransferase [Elizabethkingia anophelis]
MNTIVIYFYNLVRRIFPETSFFGIKNAILRLAGAKIGKNVRICSSVKILGNGKLIIGNNTWLGIESLIVVANDNKNPVTIVKIGSNVDIAPRTYIGTGTHVVDTSTPNIAGEGITKNIIIGDGCWICANAVILPGIEIQEKSIIAASSLVNKDVPANSLYAGIPAKFVKFLK